MSLIKQSPLIIQLEFNGSVIHEIRSADLKTDITIGRS